MSPHHIMIIAHHIVDAITLYIDIITPYIYITTSYIEITISHIEINTQYIDFTTRYIEITTPYNVFCRIIRQQRRSIHVSSKLIMMSLFHSVWWAVMFGGKSANINMIEFCSQFCNFVENWHTSIFNFLTLVYYNIIKLKLRKWKDTNKEGKITSISNTYEYGWVALVERKHIWSPNKFLIVNKTSFAGQRYSF